jgi:DNA-binding GntR family transcriptional regulator
VLGIVVDPVMSQCTDIRHDGTRGSRCYCQYKAAEEVPPMPSPTLPLTLFMDIDRSGPIPLYYQVASRIESAIADGTVPPGTRIDNELDLAQRLGLSRPTIRRAIQELVGKGLLVRRRGIGTQVVQGAVTRRMELTSLWEDLSGSGRSPETQLLEYAIEPARDQAEALGVDRTAPVLHLRRLRSAGGSPLALLENYLPEPYTDLTREALEEFGLYQLMRSRGVTFRVAQQRIGARAASTEESRLLEIARHGAVLTMDRVAYDNAGAAVEVGTHSYRPDRYSFEVTLVDR